MEGNDVQINNVPLHCFMCSVRRDFGEESVRHYNIEVVLM